MKEIDRSNPHLTGRSIRVATTPACNINCIYCGGMDGFKRGKPAAMEDFRRAPLKEGIVGTETFLQIISALHGAGFDGVTLTGGEPTLNPKWDVLIEQSVRLGMKRAELTTNGTTLSSYMKRKGKLPEGLSLIKVSLDTPDPELFAELRRGANLTTIVEGIKAISNEGVKTRANKVVLRSDMENLRKYIDFVRDLKFDEVLLLDLVFRPNQDSEEDARFFEREYVSALETADFLRNTYGLEFSSDRYGHQAKLNDFRIVLKDSNLTLRNDTCDHCPVYCQEGLYTVRVATDGNITLCPDYNAELPSLDGVRAIESGTLIDDVSNLVKTIVNAREEETLAKFMKKHNLQFNRGQSREIYS